MDEPTDARVFTPLGVGPESSKARSSCEHSPAVLAKAMQRLIKQHELPDLTTKRGIKECYANIEEAIEILLEGADAAERDVHFAAAAHVQMSMIAGDALIGEELSRYLELANSIAEALRSSCDFRVLAGLVLLGKLLPNADFDLLDELSTDVIPLLQDLIVATERDDLVLELALDVWTRWAGCMRSNKDSGYLLVDCMERLAMACRDTKRRQIASYILCRLQRVTSSTRILVWEDEKAPKMRNFFIAALRYDSAGDRLAALRGVCHSFDTLPDDDFRDDPGLHPIAVMTAADYTCITGVTDFNRLDTARSDAKHISDLRAEFIGHMRSFLASRDAHALAQALHDLLLRDPRAVDLSPKSVQRFAGGQTPQQLELPFDSWPDALQHCADALRTCSEPGCPNDHRRGANILDLQRSILRGHSYAAARIAAKLAQADQSVLWYWYALSRDLDPESLTGLLLALKALSASDSQIVKTPLYQCTLATTALSAWSFALTRGSDAPVSNIWSDIISIGPIAGWAAGEYLRSAAFDGQYVAAMTEISVSFTMWVKRPSALEIPTSSTIFETRWRAATELHARIWNRPMIPHLTSMVAAIFSHYAEAVSMYSTVLDHHITTTPPPSRNSPSEVLKRGDLYVCGRVFSATQTAAWRDLIDGEGAKSQRARTVCWRDAPSALLGNVMQASYEVRMRSCGNCGFESVVLRRCGACKTVRYCNEHCQVEDWREDHKFSCSRAYR